MLQHMQNANMLLNAAQAHMLQRATQQQLQAIANVACMMHDTDTAQMLLQSYKQKLHIAQVQALQQLLQQYNVATQ